MSTPNQPTPSLRDLCAKATPGPWKAGSRRGYNRNTIYAQNGRNEHEDSGVAQIYGIPINHHSDEPLGERYAQGEATAQLIARLSPDVALAVYEALEKTQRYLSWNCGINPYDEVVHALSLLDGTAKKGGAT